MKSNISSVIGICFFILCSFLLTVAISHRLHHTYLEDDLLWLFPSVLKVLATLPWGEAFSVFFTREFNITDSVYVGLLNRFFGMNFPMYAWLAFATHLVNAALFYFFLKRFNLQRRTCFWASLIFLCSFGHMHAYIWPLAAHHVAVLFFFFSIGYLYLRCDEAMEKGTRGTVFYVVAVLLTLLAFWQRASILMIPAVILAHMILTAKDTKIFFAKYDRWAAVMWLMITFQFAKFFVHGEGWAVHDVFKAFVIQTTLSPAAAFGLAAIICGATLIVCRIFLVLVFQRINIKTFARFSSQSLFVGVVFLQPIYLSLYTLLWPFDSARGGNIGRWQPLLLPDNVWIKVFFIFASAGLILTLCVQMYQRNKALGVFIVQLLFLIPYWQERGGAISSKYLMYATPVLAVMLSYFWWEWVWQRLGKLQRLYPYVMGCVFSGILLINIVAIHMRSLVALPVDYRASYDYIKIAHVIKAGPIHCVDNIKPIPYYHDWIQGTLGPYLFDALDPLRFYIASVSGQQNNGVLVQDHCPAGANALHFNGMTLTDQAGHSVEEFYRYYDQALRMLNEETGLSTVFLEKAVKSKPFILHVIEDKSFMGILMSRIVRHETAQTVKALFYASDHDEKTRSNDQMLYGEIQDYATALGFLAYQRFMAGETRQAESLVREALLYVPPEALRSSLVPHLKKGTSPDFLKLIHPTKSWPFAKSI